VSESSPRPIAVPIKVAAEIVGLSRAQLYREFIKPGRLRPVPTGKRDRVVIVAELEQAFKLYTAEKRAAIAAA